MRKQIHEYEITHQKLGSGASSTVWKGIHLPSQQPVAVKVIKRVKMSAKQITNGTELVQPFDHPNIVPLYYTFQSNHNYYLFFEYLDGGNLDQLLQRQSLSLLQCRRLLFQIADAIKYLHMHNYCHRDIKPQNILLTSKQVDTAVVKLADFGFARKINPDRCENENENEKDGVEGEEEEDEECMMTTICGTPYYMAPELIRRVGYSCPAKYGAAVCGAHTGHVPSTPHPGYTSVSDLWSLGIVLYQMRYGRHPFGEASTKIELYHRITTTILESPIPLTTIGEGEYWVLVRRLLVVDPRDRITYDDFFLMVELMACQSKNVWMSERYKEEKKKEINISKLIIENWIPGGNRDDIAKGDENIENMKEKKDKEYHKKEEKKEEKKSGILSSLFASLPNLSWSTPSIGIFRTRSWSDILWRH